MTWARLEDDFYDHPNFVDLPLDELGLWTCMLAYCNRHLTDGAVPNSRIRKFGGKGDGLRVAARLASRSVPDRVSGGSRSILERTPDGFRIVGYLDHNPSRIDVEAKLEVLEARKRAAGIAGGKASGRARQRNDSGQPHEKRSSLLRENEADTKQPASIETKQTRSTLLQPNEARSSPLLSDPNPPNPREGDLGPEDSEPASEPTSGTHRSRPIDGSYFSLEASSWAEGIRSVTKAVSVVPRGQEASILGEIVSNTLPAERNKWCDWLRTDAAAFAKANDPKYGFSVKRYADWVRSGRPLTSAASGSARPTPAVSGIGPAYRRPFRFDD